MKLAFCLFKYFPFGGLQRDFLRIAQECLERGHSAEVFTMEWNGDIPDGLKVTVLPVKGLSNHAKCKDFVSRVATFISAEAYDAVIGFNKMPNLDVYYAADPCFVSKAQQKHGGWFRATSRYRTYASFEEAVFGSSSATEILLISEVEKENFVRIYQTPSERFHSLPPGISRDRGAPDEPCLVRRDFRNEMGFEDDAYLILMVGSGFRTKGLDRAIRALASLPSEKRTRARLLVVGQDKAAPYLKLARKLGVEDRLLFLGGRPDIPRFLASSDLLIHPAYHENTGTVLLEAVIAGLPVLATDVCGYAGYIRQSGAGLLVPSPYEQEKLDELLSYMLDAPERPEWTKNALAFAREADIYSMPQRAADLIESVAFRRRGV